MHWAKRERGLIVRPDSHIQRLADLQGKRFVSRQAGAAAHCYSKLIFRAQVDLLSIALFEPLEPRPTPHYQLLRARLTSLSDSDLLLIDIDWVFVPICVEHFDLLIDRFAYFEPEIKYCCASLCLMTFWRKLTSMQGMTLTDLMYPPERLFVIASSPLCLRYPDRRRLTTNCKSTSS